MYTVGTTFTKYWNIMEAAGRREHWAWVPGRALVAEGYLPGWYLEVQ